MSDLKKFRKFKIKNSIVLGFIIENKQCDILIDDGTIEFDGVDIYRLGIDGKTMYKSITSNDIIDICLANESLEEI